MRSIRFYLSAGFVALGAILLLLGLFFPALYLLSANTGTAYIISYSVLGDRFPGDLSTTSPLSAHSLMETVFSSLPLAFPCVVLILVGFQMFLSKRHPSVPYLQWVCVIASTLFLLGDMLPYIDVLLRGTIITTPILYVREVGILFMIVGTILEQRWLKQGKKPDLHLSQDE